MAHAVVINVTIDPDSDREHRHSILHEFVLPGARVLPGFEKGMWMNDGGGTGVCVVVFDTEQHAQGGGRSVDPARWSADRRVRSVRGRSRGVAPATESATCRLCNQAGGESRRD
jgi:hypothetical protein